VTLAYKADMRKLPVLLSLLATSLASTGALAEDVTCPQNRGFSDKNCILHYMATTLADPAGYVLKYAPVLDILLESDTENPSVDRACSPHLARFASRVRWNFLIPGCGDATPEAVQAVIDTANHAKAFCRKKADGSYDLYGLPRFRSYVIRELRKAHPEMCR
jgi:hypothetical protein